MPRQLTFDLPARPALGRGDFFVSESNAMALSRLDDWHHWTNCKLLLIGPQGAGKSHLAQVWAGETGAQIISATKVNLIGDTATATGLVVEDVDDLAGDQGQEEALFHLFNVTRANNNPMLFTAAAPVRNWGIRLPDLLSRMQSIDVATLSSPDDSLLAMVMVKLFADRQLAVRPEVVEYITKRMERSFAALHELVAALDAHALAENRAVTRALAAEVLDNLSRTRA